MHPIHTYVLMAFSTTFYCLFETSIKGHEFQHFNNQTNVVFKDKCDVQECLGKTLKFYDNGVLLEEGFLAITTVFHGFNATLIESGKNEFRECLFETNMQLVAIPRCSKLQTGVKLLELCMEKKLKKIRSLLQNSNSTSSFHSAE